MPQVIAVIAPGAMGAAVARRLAEHGAEVRTLLDGRSAATAKRAEAAGMRAATEAEVAAAEVVLSIGPPAEAITLVRRPRVRPARAPPGPTRAARRPPRERAGRPGRRSAPPSLASAARR